METPVLPDDPQNPKNKKQATLQMEEPVMILNPLVV